MKKMIDDALLDDESAQASKFVKNWRPGIKRRPLVSSRRAEDFMDEITPGRWRPGLDKRCGAIAIKVGMMPVWDKWGERHPCTVLYLDSNVVIKTWDGSSLSSSGGNGNRREVQKIAIQVGAGGRKAKNISKGLLGHYAANGIDIEQPGGPPYIVREFPISDPRYLPEQGSVIHASHFVPGQALDISGISKGKGFQGAMKRHNFKGMPASHGTSLSHRALGSTGQCQDPGKVFKGKKMAGRMGAKRRTVQNIRLVKIDRGRNLLYVLGGVPGQKGNFVEVRDAVKRPLFGTEAVLDLDLGSDDNDSGKSGENLGEVGGNIKFPPLPSYPPELGVDGCGEGGHEWFMPLGHKDPFAPNEDEPPL